MSTREFGGRRRVAGSPGSSDRSYADERIGARSANVSALDGSCDGRYSAWRRGTAEPITGGSLCSAVVTSALSSTQL